jgi:RNA polymerase sigma-70 factor (ECF subfamily)
VRHNLQDLDDTQLALRAQQGDQSAFGLLYDRHAGGIARALASFAGPDQHTLDDLVQEVFSRAIKGLPSWRPKRPFPHWLYTIALNVGRNRVRSRSSTIPTDPSELESMRPARCNDADCSAEGTGAKAMRLAAQLPIRLREVVSLRIGFQMPYAQIAEMLGIPEGTARSRMHTAIEALRRRMGVEVPNKERKCPKTPTSRGY